MMFIVIIIIAIIVILRALASLMIVIIMSRGRSFQVQWLVCKETHHGYTNTHTWGPWMMMNQAATEGYGFMRTIRTAGTHSWNDRHPRGSESNEWHDDSKDSLQIEVTGCKKHMGLSELTLACSLWSHLQKEYGVKWAFGEFMRT